MSTDYYIVDNYTCDPTCLFLSVASTPTSLCFECLDTCNGCATVYTHCLDCFVSQFRLLNGSTFTCDCNTTGGYFDNGNIVCDKCIDYLDGC